MCRTCGHRLEECTDPNRDWFPQRHIDYAAMEQAAALWRYQELHKDRPYHSGKFNDWSAERTAAHPYSYMDGVTVFVATTDLAPSDEFLSEEKAAPSASGPLESDRDPSALPRAEAAVDVTGDH